ncbi:hypothetical protein YA0089_26765 [Pseudomonas viridiflava]|uniref:hypothetical protein n=1 Tax=Pseudomonas viridiflava TaxID=33069 RepID=UPI0018E62B6E|nr:hypothetical protein [Pseudomonas viridiflava]MBI6727221.1 hypothetical protein [Pseudomonas viridiflava]
MSAKSVIGSANVPHEINSRTKETRIVFNSTMERLLDLTKEDFTSLILAKAFGEGGNYKIKSYTPLNVNGDGELTIEVLVFVGDAIQSGHLKVIDTPTFTI